MRRGGRLALRWAEGPGRQSGLWALNAMVLAALPLLDMARPECATATCAANWERLLFVPRILFLPTLVLGLVFAGSWWAQARHDRVHKRYFSALPADGGVEAPPGQVRPKTLQRDLVRRTLRGVAAGALLAAAGLLWLTTTRLALRMCDPWRFERPTGLAVCQDSAGWADTVVAFEVWTLLGLALAFALTAYVASRRIVVEDLLPASKKRRGRRGWART